MEDTNITLDKIKELGVSNGTAEVLYNLFINYNIDTYVHNEGIRFQFRFTYTRPQSIIIDKLNRVCYNNWELFYNGGYFIYTSLVRTKI